MDVDLHVMRSELDQLWRKVGSNVHHRFLAGYRFGARSMALRLLASESDKSCRGMWPACTDSEGGLSKGACWCGEGSDSQSNISGFGSSCSEASSCQSSRSARTGGGNRDMDFESNLAEAKRLTWDELELARKIVTRLEEDKVLRWKGRMKDDLLLAMEREKEGLVAEVQEMWEKVGRLETRLAAMQTDAAQSREEAESWEQEGRKCRETEREASEGEARDRDGRRIGASPPPGKSPRMLSWERERLAMEAYAERVTKDLAAAQQNLMAISAQNTELEEKLATQTASLREAETNLASARRDKEKMAEKLEAALGGWTDEGEEAAACRGLSEELVRKIRVMERQVGKMEVVLREAERERDTLRQQQQEWQQERRSEERQELKDLLRMESVGKWLETAESEVSGRVASSKKGQKGEDQVHPVGSENVDMWQPSEWLKRTLSGVLDWETESDFGFKCTSLGSETLPFRTKEPPTLPSGNRFTMVGEKVPSVLAQGRAQMDNPPGFQAWQPLDRNAKSQPFWAPLARRKMVVGPPPPSKEVPLLYQ